MTCPGSDSSPEFTKFKHEIYGMQEDVTLLLKGMNQVMDLIGQLYNSQQYSQVVLERLDQRAAGSDVNDKHSNNNAIMSILQDMRKGQRDFLVACTDKLMMTQSESNSEAVSPTSSTRLSPRGSKKVRTRGDDVRKGTIVEVIQPYTSNGHADQSMPHSESMNSNESLKSNQKLPLGRSETNDSSMTTSSKSAAGKSVEERQRRFSGVLDQSHGEAYQTVNEYQTEAQSYGPQTFKEHVQNFIKTDKLDRVAGLVILANVVMVGIETDLSLKSTVPLYFRWIEVVFTLAYVVELALRLYAFGFYTNWKDRWVRFDMVIVGSGFTSFILAFGLWAAGARYIARLAMLRMLKLLKLVRAVRLLGMFREIWKLIRGIWAAVSTIGAAFVLLFFTVYVAGIIAVEGISKNQEMQNDPLVMPTIEEYYWGVLPSMVSLVRFMHGDGITDLYEPLIFNYFYTAVFFIALGMLITIALMNTVTAILVDSCIEATRQDKEMKNEVLKGKLKKLVPEFRKVFQELDTNGDGLLEREDISTAWEQVQAVLKGILSQWGIDVNGGHTLTMSLTPEELFQYLDTDGNGEIEQDEFVNVVVTLAEQDTGDANTRMLSNLHMHRSLMNTIKDDVRCLLPDTANNFTQLQQQSKDIAEVKRACNALLSLIPGLALSPRDNAMDGIGYSGGRNSHQNPSSGPAAVSFKDGSGYFTA
jgi:voltage-gated sodium channel